MDVRANEHKPLEFLSIESPNRMSSPRSFFRCIQPTFISSDLLYYLSHRRDMQNK